MEKYFPRNLTLNNIRLYKPYIFNVILNFRFKLYHFKEDNILNYYSNIEKDIENLFIEKYNK